MPVYGTVIPGNQRLIYPGDTFALFAAEKPLTGQASVSVCISELWNRRVTGLSFEFIFAAAPGAFNYQIQGADTDADPAFQTEGSGTVTAVTVMSDGTSRARVELSPWVAKFCRVFINTQNANAVAVTINVTPI